VSEALALIRGRTPRERYRLIPSRQSVSALRTLAIVAPFGLALPGRGHAQDHNPRGRQVQSASLLIKSNLALVTSAGHEYILAPMLRTPRRRHGTPGEAISRSRPSFKGKRQ